MKPTVLVSGAGVAGLTLAYWLQRFGFAPTIVENAPTLRSGGQAVDVRGVALDVLEAMQSLDEARALRTRFKGMVIVDRDGREQQRTQERTYSGGRLDSGDIELFRDALCELLLSRCQGIALRMGDSITGLAQGEDHVGVSFVHAQPQEFDLVIGADGIHSNVRRLGMADVADPVQSMGVVLALYTTPNLLQLDHWELAHREATLGLVAYPTLDHSELRVGIGFEGQTDAALRSDLQAQKAMVKAGAASLGGSLRPLIDAMDDTPQFYLGDIAQVHLSRWSNGRVALVGDAAHCASPFSGQGTSLALVGGFVLARELANAPTRPALAFQRYEQRMRPFVALNQALVDLNREGPVPDEQLTQAKFAIALDDLPATT